MTDAPFQNNEDNHQRCQVISFILLSTFEPDVFSFVSAFIHNGQGEGKEARVTIH